MQNFILITLLLIGFQSHAEHPSLESSFEYRVDSVRANPDLPVGKSQVIVCIKNENFSGGNILFGYDGLGFEVVLDEAQSFQFELDSGKHFFQFYPSNKFGFEEITTGTINTDAGTTTYMTLDFKMTMEIELHVKKPVIYLYPAQKTAVSVTVQPTGEMIFTYPAYTGKWECTAFPSGEILIENKAYNYLFWEAEQTVEIKELNQTFGIVVAQEDLLEFLESALDKYGFNSKEKMDFITYWAPQMIQYEATEIRFMINEECALFADLDIEPKPDNLLRFYMIWNPTDPFYLDKKATLDIPTQNRTGFTVLEWGGMEIPRGDRPEQLKNSTSRSN